MSHFYDLERMDSKDLVDGVTLQTVWGERIMLSRVVIAPGAEVPLHDHPHEQAGTLLEGLMEMTIGDETRELTPGDSYVIPGGVMHSARAIGGGVVVLDIFSPPREEYK